MLRLLIGTGVLLMVVGFGAAGWQYWQTLPASPEAVEAAVPERAAPTRQTWLISPTGGLVSQADVQTYLAQERLVPERTVAVTLQANLADLLVGDEKLPDTTFLQVLADIRAPKVADGLCDVLRQTIAADCALNAARVVEGSVDPATGTARFQLELVYRLKEAEAELPDLAAHVFRSKTLRLELASADAGVASAAVALAEAVDAVTGACAAEGVGRICRPMRLWLDWTPGQPVAASSEIGWLDPLPKGMFVAPPLQPATGG